MLRIEPSASPREILRDLAAVLWEARSPELVARIAAREVQALTEADVAVIHRAGANLVALGLADAAGGDAAELRDQNIDLAGPLGLAVVERRAVWVERAADLQQRFPRFVERLRGPRRFAAIAVVPLVADGVVLGTLTVAWREDLAFGSELAGLVLGLGEVVAEAVDRTFAGDREALRLFQLARQERIAAEEERRRAEEANRIKDEFLTTVSHELRTPLTAIIGWAEILRTEHGLSRPKLEKGLEVIRNNARAQAKLVDDVLDVSRMIAGALRLDPSPADLVTIVRDVLEVVRHSAQAKGVQVRVGELDGPVLLACDRARINQAIWNLLSNAVKFTPEGGAVTVHVRRTGPEASLVVEDTGVGLSPEFLPHVFERFRQADSSITRRHGGLGLGLAIVRHVAELHGGRVAAESDGLGRGARFTMTLPVRAILPVPAQAHPIDAAPTPIALPSDADLADLRVLVLDDDHEARELIRDTLAFRGAHVETCAAVGEAVARLARFKPHVLLSDIGMPGEDGYTLIRRVRALPVSEGGAVPAVALTGYARSEDRVRVLGAGFDGHLAKPVDPEALAATIASLGRSHPRLTA